MDARKVGRTSIRQAHLVRYFVLFVIDIERRRVQIAGIVHQPYRAWMKQIARNLTDNVDGFLSGTRYLIHDRDPLFSDEFREVLRAAGVKCLKLPAHSPNLKDDASHCTSSVQSDRTCCSSLRSDSFFPCCLRGAAPSILA